MKRQITKKTCVCECTASAFVTKDIVRLEFLWPGPAPWPGQFFLIRPRRTAVFLARPISVASWKPNTEKASGENETADKPFAESGGTLRFLVALRGQGSRDIACMIPGEVAELTGPLGNYWPIERVPKGPVALIAGGIGIAPLLSLAAELGKSSDDDGYDDDIYESGGVVNESAGHVHKPAGYAHDPAGYVFDFYAGFRSSPFGQKLKARTLIIVTEDGSVGEKGRITDFFRPSGYSRVFACGPEPMLRTVAKLCAAGRIPCYISVERHMACGVGACLGCTVKTIWGNRRCCVDGPIFNAEDISFDG